MTSHVPPTPESESITSCGFPQNYNASKEFADKKVVLFAVPGNTPPSQSRSQLSPIREYRLYTQDARDFQRRADSDLPTRRLHPWLLRTPSTRLH